jgi:serine/threonine protein kinase
MAFPSGTRLGPFEILEPVGKGGMGDVYRARDTRLDRTVAIKVLQADGPADASARERLEREARAVSALNHPHICTLYDVGRHDDTDFLVMEFVDGETLTARLERGPIPLPQALRYAIELASALDRAHRAGIVHRDFKPGNVMITKSGAKLLDFGLAKPSPVTLGGTPLLQTASRDDLTRSGTIVGTVQYMAPEQVDGRVADARTDIFSFGAVLYEMLSGRKAFEGQSVGSLFAAILEKDPPRLATLQPLTPPSLDRIVSTCLAKDPDDRWQSARDLMRELQWISAGRNATTADDIKERRSWNWLLVAAASLAIGAAGALLLFSPWRAENATGAASHVRFSIYPEPGSQFVNAPASVVTPQFAISPDGTHIAFVASAAGRAMLWVRSVDAWHARVLPGTEDPLYPFWSPDSTSVAFFSQGRIKAVTLTGGEPVVRGDASRDPRGGAWAPDGTIFATTFGYGGIMSVTASGAQPVLPVDRKAGEANHRWPMILADGRHLVYVVRSREPSRRGITLAALGEQSGTRLADSDYSAAVAGQHLLFVRGRTLMAQPLDLEKGQLFGEAVPIMDDVGASSTGHSAFSVSQTGTLAFANTWPVEGELVWFDRSGRQLGAPVAPRADYVTFSLSPDETRVALSTVDPQTATPDIWVLDLARGSQHRLTSDRMTDANAFWSPSGNELVFRSNRAGANRPYRRGVHDLKSEVLIDFGTPDEVLSNMVLTDLSRDGRHIILTNTGRASSFDIWRHTDGAEPLVQPIVESSFDEFHAVLSPDQRWIAYVSNETGRPEIYVTSFPDGTRRYPISSQGGSEPQWRRNGQELFFLNAESMLMSVSVTTGPEFKAGVPTPLFRVRTPTSANPYRQQYAVAQDGNRFLVNRARDDAAPPAINVVLDWRTLLPRSQN